MEFKRICLVVLDSVGIGELPDADLYGDIGAHTLGHIAEQAGLILPHLQQMGLGNIEQLQGIEPQQHPKSYYGKMNEASKGKDTMTGHWELMGLKVDIPFKTYPEGFPPELLDPFIQRTGRPVIGNKAASGTEIIMELGEEQMRTGAWIVYTSADSVFQLAANEEVIPLEELYRACEIARALTLTAEHSVGRVIARPFKGKPGGFQRTTNRHDYAVEPPAPTVLNFLKDTGLDSIAVGKINDIFTGSGITEAYPAKSNEHGMDLTINKCGEDFQGLLFTNLVDFDSLYGHRRDPAGYARALEEFDLRLPELMGVIGVDDLLILTADHGNDPTHHGTDHTREYVPLLVWNPAFTKPRSLGIRTTFADIGATIADNFQVQSPPMGRSFLAELT
ncbi:MAG TPA: phosphopentomutase [Bacilli bacterium]